MELIMGGRSPLFHLVMKDPIQMGKLHLTCVLLLVMFLIPTASHGYGELLLHSYLTLSKLHCESIINSILKSMPEYLSMNGEQFEIKSVQSSVTDSIVNGYMKYTAGAYNRHHQFGT